MNGTFSTMTGDERNGARQPVELGDNDRRPPAPTARLGQCGGELWAAIERIGALAAFDLDELGGDLEAFNRGEAANRLSLGRRGLVPSGPAPGSRLSRS
jgi:hypothetical protein